DDLPRAFDEELECVLMPPRLPAIDLPFVEGVVAAALQDGSHSVDAAAVCLKLLSQGRIGFLQLTNPMVELTSREGADENVVATIELMAIRKDLIPWWVAKHDIETWFVAVEEDFGEFQLPVEEPFPFPHLVEVRAPRAPLGVSLQPLRRVDEVA